MKRWTVTQIQELLRGLGFDQNITNYITYTDESKATFLSIVHRAFGAVDYFVFVPT